MLLDDPTCKGPVAGLLAAVRHALLIGAEALVFQPVDMPFLTSQALVELRTRAIQNNAIAIACGPAVGDKAVGDKVWTLGAIPASMLLQVEQRIVGLIGHNEGTTRSSPGLRNVFSDLNVVAVSFSDHILRNVNTPSDLASHDEEHI